MKDEKILFAGNHLSGKTAIDEYNDCPTCHASINKLAMKEILKDYAKTLKSSAELTECKDCGLIVPEKNQSCPNCGGTKGNRIRK